MIKYYDKLLLSLSEIPGHPSMLVHALTGCTFHCYNCFNYDLLINTKHDTFYSIDNLLVLIKKQENLFDYLIFSGGEYLAADIDDLISDLTKVRKNTDKKIIIYTTGVYYSKMKTLFTLGLVDGFHIDMKLPYHLLTEDDFELIELTMGLNLNNLKIFEDLLKSIDFVVSSDLGNNRIRTVRYPFASESSFEECQSYINGLNKKYGSNVPYDINPFVYPEKK